MTEAIKSYLNKDLLNRLSEIQQSSYYATACHTLVKAEMAIVGLEDEIFELRARIAEQDAEIAKLKEAGEPVAKYIGECCYGSLVQLYDDLKKDAKLFTRPAPKAAGEPVAFIRKDQLEKARVSASLCEVTSEPRADRVAIFTRPARQPMSDEQITEVYEKATSQHQRREMMKEKQSYRTTSGIPTETAVLQRNWVEAKDALLQARASLISLSFKDTKTTQTLESVIRALGSMGVL